MHCFTASAGNTLSVFCTYVNQASSVVYDILANGLRCGSLFAHKFSLTAGIYYQFTTSFLGLIMALLGFVLAIMELWKHKKNYEDNNDKDFLATAMCFLVSFSIGNLISLIRRIISPSSGFMFFHSIVNPLWPLVTTLPTIRRFLVNKCKREKVQPTMRTI